MKNKVVINTTNNGTAARCLRSGGGKDYDIFRNDGFRISGIIEYEDEEYGDNPDWESDKERQEGQPAKE